MHYRLARVALAWISGLLIVQAAATFYFAQRASVLAARAADLAERGLFAPPAGGAVEFLQAPGAWLLAGLPYTLCLGASTVVLAHLCADLVARRRRLRVVPPLSALAAASLLAWQFGAPALWASLCGAFLVPYGLLSDPDAAATARYAPTAVAARWMAVALLILPAATVLGPHHLVQARTVMLALPGGEAVVNGYYRYAMFAAEPIKRPEQRYFRTYAGSDDLPHAWRCLRDPFLLLPVDGPAYSDLILTPAGVDEPGADIGAMATRLAAREADYRFALRGLLLVAVPVGVPLALAYGLASAATDGRRWRRAALSCAVAGFGLAAALAIGERPVHAVQPDSEGTAQQRMQAASAAETPTDELDRLLRVDQLLTVRARALAQRVLRFEYPEEAVPAIASAASWYEQWHGYGALLHRGWHPERACRA